MTQYERQMAVNDERNRVSAFANRRMVNARVEELNRAADEMQAVSSFAADWLRARAKAVAATA